MKPSTLSRLDLLAAAQEAQALETLRRQGAALRQNETQARVLEAYRLRLAASWQDGAEIAAADVQRAARFTAGALSAAKQVEEARAEAASRLEAAAADLAALKQRRRKLAERRRAAQTAAQAQAQDKLSRDLTNSPKPGRRPQGSA